MELSKFLSGRHRKDAGPSTPGAPASSPPAPAQPAAGEVEATLDDFAAIQSLLEQQGDAVALPLSVLLRHLPPELQGPEWHDGPLPGGEILLDRENLAAQLRKGKLSYKLSDLGGDMPVGWIRGGSDAEVTLDLRGVVEALPEDFFRLNGQISPDMIDAATMRDYFGPSIPGPAASRMGPTAGEPPRAETRGGPSPDGDRGGRAAESLIMSVLPMEPGTPLDLPTILDSVVRFLSARAALLASPDGSIVARTKDMQALAPGLIPWLQESRDRLRSIQADPVHTLGMPTAAPPLLVCASPSWFWIVESGPEAPSREALLRLQSVLMELDALISSRCAGTAAPRTGR